MGQRESQPWAQCMCATQNTGQSKVTKHLMNEMFENYRVPKVAKVAKVYFSFQTFHHQVSLEWW